MRQFDQRKFYPTFAFDIGILYRTLDCKKRPVGLPCRQHKVEWELRFIGSGGMSLVVKLKHALNSRQKSCNRDWLRHLAKDPVF